MKLISENPFRILSLPVDSDIKLIKRKVSELEMYCAMGQFASDDEEMCNLIFPKIIYSKAVILDAYNQISKDSDRLFCSLFWFQIKNKIDSDAFAALKENKIDKARFVLNQAIFSEQIDEYNFTNYKNLALLSFIQTSNCGHDRKSEILKGIVLFVKVLYFFINNKFYFMIPGTSYISNVDYLIGRFAKEFTYTFKQQVESEKLFTLEEIISSVSLVQGTEELKNHISKEFSSIPLDIINRRIEEAEKKIDDEKFNPFEVGIKLYNSTIKTYEKSVNVIPAYDYILISDKFAEVLRLSAVKYFNKYTNQIEVEDIIQNSKFLINSALSLAKSELLTERIINDINVIEEWGYSGKYFNEIENIFNNVPRNIYILSDDEIHVYPSHILRAIESCEDLLKRVENDLGPFNNISFELTELVILRAMNSLVDYANYTKKYQLIVGVCNKLSNFGMSSEIREYFNENVNMLNKNLEVREQEDGSGFGSIVYFIIVIIVLIIIFMN